MNDSTEVMRAVIIGEGRRAVNGMFRVYHNGRRVLAGYMSERFHFKGEGPGARLAVLVAAALGGAVLVTLACNRDPESVADTDEVASPPVPTYPMVKAIPAAVPQNAVRQRRSIDGPVPDSVARQMGYPPLNYSPDGEPEYLPGQESRTMDMPGANTGPGGVGQYPDLGTRSVPRSQVRPDQWSMRSPVEQGATGGSAWNPGQGSARYSAAGRGDPGTGPGYGASAPGIQGYPPGDGYTGSTVGSQRPNVWPRSPTGPATGGGYSRDQYGSAVGQGAYGEGTSNYGRQAVVPGYDTGAWNQGGGDQGYGAQWPGTWQTPGGSSGGAGSGGVQPAGQYPPLPYYGNR
ncbi:MAG: hypothetical protein U9R74_07375 [Pseudomonadota bacterium]|nr:hypothetical protein [Pseudomonadota bacterium]